MVFLCSCWFRGRNTCRKYQESEDAGLKQAIEFHGREVQLTFTPMSLDEKDRAWIASELTKVRVDVDRSLAAEVAKVRVDIERVETSLLTEFHKWASPMEMRVKTHSLALRALDLEMESISERVEKLEPPH